MAAGKVRVANYHTGGIVFPRSGANGVVLPPLRLAPGRTTEVDKEEWDKRKAMPIVQKYLDKGLLGVVRKEGAVPVSETTSTELTIPDHLTNEEETGATETVKVKVKRSRAGSVQVD